MHVRCGIFYQQGYVNQKKKFTGVPFGRFPAHQAIPKAVSMLRVAMKISLYARKSSMRQVHCSLMRCVAVLLLSVVNENIAGGNPCRAFSVKRRNKYYARGVALPAADVDLGMGFQNGSLRWGTAGGLCCGLPLFHTPVVDSSHVYLCRGNLIP